MWVRRGEERRGEKVLWVGATRLGLLGRARLYAECVLKLVAHGPTPHPTPHPTLIWQVTWSLPEPSTPPLWTGSGATGYDARWWRSACAQAHTSLCLHLTEGGEVLCRCREQACNPR